MSTPPHSHYVTANDLLTGEVVFLAEDGRWVASLADALLLADPDDSASKLARAEADTARVVGPYLARAGAGPEPLHFRERFRATGPSNYFHGKQERDADV